MSLYRENSEKIKAKALQLGFSTVGISKADFLESESKRLNEWLNKGFHGEMSYMENHFEKRTDPRELVDNAKSVISVLLNYYPLFHQPEDTYKISKYAYGRDYHFVVKEKLHQLLDFVKEIDSKATGRAFVDSAPVMDKVWAVRSGLGWIGKNTNLISKKNGSFTFIGEIIIDIELEYDNPMKDFCGSCTKCIDACPTKALIPYQLDARKCISYLTIENKNEIPEEFKGKMNDWIFGCDICQDVCPWNSKLESHKIGEFNLGSEVLTFQSADWEKLTPQQFNHVFKESPVERAGYDGLKRNIRFLKME